LLSPFDNFREMMRRMRAGDEQAAEQFVRACEPHIQQAVRFPLRYHRLHNVLDCADISQAVLADFFRRKLAFRESLKTHAQCLRLLVRMARCKVMDEVRKSQALCRDQRRRDGQLSDELAALVDHRDAAPGGIAADNELAGEVYRRLSDKERLLAQLRSSGLDWITIARIYGSTPDSARKKLARAMRRIGHELGLQPFVQA
jgi:DNA-directed RNA polymerase specialized sigma24 family protein